MATNKIAAISNTKWLICNQDYTLLIKGIIIIPSAIWSEHMPVFNDRALFRLSLYLYLNVFIFKKPTILQQFRIYYWCHFQTIKNIANSLCLCMQTLSANVTLQTILPCDNYLRSNFIYNPRKPEKKIFFSRNRCERHNGNIITNTFFWSKNWRNYHDPFNQ